MSKYHQLSNIGLKKYYIITRPTQVDEVDDEVIEEDYNWLAKSRRLQARRWQKIEDELA